MNETSWFATPFVRSVMAAGETGVCLALPQLPSHFQRTHASHIQGMIEDVIETTRC